MARSQFINPNAEMFAIENLEESTTDGRLLRPQQDTSGALHWLAAIDDNHIADGVRSASSQLHASSDGAASLGALPYTTPHTQPFGSSDGPAYVDWRSNNDFPLQFNSFGNQIGEALPLPAAISRTDMGHSLMGIFDTSTGLLDGQTEKDFDIRRLKLLESTFLPAMGHPLDSGFMEIPILSQDQHTHQGSVEAQHDLAQSRPLRYPNLDDTVDPFVSFGFTPLPPVTAQTFKTQAGSSSVQRPSTVVPLAGPADVILQCVHSRDAFKNYPSSKKDLLPCDVTFLRICQEYPNHLWGNIILQFVQAGWTEEQIWNACPEGGRHNCQNGRPWNYLQQRVRRARNLPTGPSNPNKGRKKRKAEPEEPSAGVAQDLEPRASQPSTEKTAGGTTLKMPRLWQRQPELEQGESSKSNQQLRIWSPFAHSWVDSTKAPRECRGPQDQAGSKEVGPAHRKAICAAVQEARDEMARQRRLLLQIVRLHPRTEVVPPDGQEWYARKLWSTQFAKWVNAFAAQQNVQPELQSTQSKRDEVTVLRLACGKYCYPKLAFETQDRQRTWTEVEIFCWQYFRNELKNWSSTWRRWYCSLVFQRRQHPLHINIAEKASTSRPKSSPKWTAAQQTMLYPTLQGLSLNSCSEHIQFPRPRQTDTSGDGCQAQKLNSLAPEAEFNVMHHDLFDETSVKFAEMMTGEQRSESRLLGQASLPGTHSRSELPTSYTQHFLDLGALRTSLAQEGELPAPAHNVSGFAASQFDNFSDILICSSEPQTPGASYSLAEDEKAESSLPIKLGSLPESGAVIPNVIGDLSFSASLEDPVKNNAGEARLDDSLDDSASSDLFFTEKPRATDLNPKISNGLLSILEKYPNSLAQVEISQMFLNKAPIANYRIHPDKMVDVLIRHTNSVHGSDMDAPGRRQCVMDWLLEQLGKAREARNGKPETPKSKGKEVVREVDSSLMVS